MRLPGVDTLRRFVAVTSTLGIGLLLLALWRDGRSLLGLEGPELLFFVAIIVGECVPLRLHRRGSETEITTSSTFAFALLLTAPPVAALLAMAIGVAISDSRRRKPFERVAFNVAQHSVSLVAAGLVLAWLTGIPRADAEHPFEPTELPAIALAAATYFVLNAVLVARAITYAEGTRFFPYLREDFVLQTSTVGLMLGLAPIVVITSSYSLLALPMLGLPLLAVHRSGREMVEKEQQALHDSLTGLPNRVLFADRVEQALRISAREQASTAVMVVDLDRFKEVNDTLGHHHGDLLLQAVADRLNGAVRDSDTVARLGGDEFAIVLPGLHDLDSIGRIAQEARAAVAHQLMLDDVSIEVDASIGIAYSPAHGDDLNTLLRHADVAMYRAKGAGTGYEIYSEDDDNSLDRLKLIGELREALGREELHLVYQPKASVVDGSVAAVESLLRWDHPERGEIAPDVFIPLAEQSGLITTLTCYTIRTAVAQARAWLDAGLELSVAVNLSPRCLVDAGLVDEIGQVLTTAGLPPGQLTLEITESMVMNEPERAHRVLARLNAMGVRLSLDDFGKGCSSLAHLKDLPVQELKIDRSFVTGMDTDRANAAIVRSTIDLAHDLGLRVVAEGVESRAVLRRLAVNGCDLAQGYLVCEPLRAETLAARLLGHDGVLLAA